MKPTQVYDANGVPCIAYTDQPPNPLIEVGRSAIKVFNFLCMAWFLFVVACGVLILVGYAI